jgi:endoglucanase
MLHHSLPVLLVLLPLLAACVGAPAPMPSASPPAARAEATTSVPPRAEEAAPAPTSPPWPSADEMLQRTWESYRHEFIQDDGRTKDPMRDLATTSEGQSYSLLRAVWMDDRATFERVLRWSNDNLRVRGDQLFGFLWGRHADGSWSILDANVASDADQDIALALVFAHRRWGEARYLEQAQGILADLWSKTVVEVGGRPYLTAGDWAAQQEQPTLNPSYLAPYAYRIFATVDPSRNWIGLVDTSYEVVLGCTQQALDSAVSANLPANWCGIDRTTGTLRAPLAPLDTHFGYDAFRTYWRIALDARWYGDQRAYAYMGRSGLLRERWLKDRTLASVYRHDGEPLNRREDPTIYGGLIGNLILSEPQTAELLYSYELAPRYAERDGQAFWGEPRNYYMQNWMWFGVALYAERLPNLAA